MSSGVVVLYYRIYSRIFATLLQDAHACNATQACHMQWCSVWLEFWEEGNKTIQQAFSCGQSCYSDPPHGMRARACCFSLDLHCYSSEVHSPARGQRQRAKLNHRKRERTYYRPREMDVKKKKRKDVKGLFGSQRWRERRNTCMSTISAYDVILWWNLAHD